MSSVRIDSLRLVWLEAFVQVAEAENISEAARELGCDQSTVSRHLQSLQKWLGKKLIEPGQISDYENPGVNIGLTEEGREFRNLAADVIERLTAFRTEEARRKELLTRIESMISKMLADLESKHPSQTVLSVEEKIAVQVQTLAALRSAGEISILEGFYPSFRRFFANYESQLKRERPQTRKRSRRKRTK